MIYIRKYYHIDSPLIFMNFDLEWYEKINNQNVYQATTSILYFLPLGVTFEMGVPVPPGPAEMKLSKSIRETTP